MKNIVWKTKNGRSSYHLNFASGQKKYYSMPEFFFYMISAARAMPSLYQTAIPLRNSRCQTTPRY